MIISHHISVPVTLLLVVEGEDNDELKANVLKLAHDALVDATKRITGNGISATVGEAKIRSSAKYDAAALADKAHVEA